MKLYYCVYMRPAGTEIAGTSPALGNILDGWDKLDLVPTGTKLTIEPENRDMGDGTQYTEAEVIKLETSTLRVDKAEYAYLRSTYHNVRCDAMLFDPASHLVVAIVYGMKIKVSKLVENDQSVVVKLDGMRKMADANITVLTPASLEDYSILSGIVYAHDGVTPVPGVAISITVSTVDYEDTTDKDGQYLICLPIGAHTFTPTLTGGWVFPKTTITAIEDQEVVTNIEADTDGA